jgi:hypothetical protein
MATNTVSQKTLPGPFALPLFGRGANMAKVFVDLWTNTRRLHDTYGDVVALAQGDLRPPYKALHILNVGNCPAATGTPNLTMDR